MLRRFLQLGISALLVPHLFSQSTTFAPLFTTEQVLPANRSTPAPLVPGMLFSIYGRYLGPDQGCEGAADSQRLETQDPAHPFRPFANRLIYPKNLCEVKVFVSGLPAGLLYVQEKMINFKVPWGIPAKGMAAIRVSYRGKENQPVKIAVGVATVTLSVDGEARVGGPVWIRINLPEPRAPLSYPVSLQPDNFGCREFEVRRNGVQVHRIPIRSWGGIASAGFPCGSISLPGNGARHSGRLPLHLQFRFDQPGISQVRYRETTFPFDSKAKQVTEESRWTPIKILPAKRVPAHNPPVDAEEILTDYLPGVLGFRDAAGLDIDIHFLYHPDELVRRYASAALGYWPEHQVNLKLEEALRTKGPGDTFIFRLVSWKPELIDLALPYLQSNDPILLRGAIEAIGPASPQRAITALLAASEVLLQNPDQDILSRYLSLLGFIRDARAVPVLQMAMRQAKSEEIRISCARGLMLVANPAGFAFVVEAIANNQPYKERMVAIVRNEFPELHSADENSILAFAKKRAQ